MEILLLAGALFALATLERIPALRRVALPLRRAGFGMDSLYLATGAVALSAGVRALATRFHGALAPPIAWPSELAALGATLVAADLLAWLAHLAMHRFEPLWRLHAVHHSSRTLDWLATFRAHPLEHLLRHASGPGLLLLAGFAPRHVALAAALAGAWGALNHANLRFGPRWLERVLVTPRLHRLHHVTASSECNLGGLFVWWDRLAGRLVREDAPAGAALGVPGAAESFPQHWGGQMLVPFRRLSAPPSFRAAA